MVVRKTKKVTKVTKHKVTNNKTKKRNKNKQGGGPQPSNRPKSASSAKPPPLNTRELLSSSSAPTSVSSTPRPVASTPRKLSASNFLTTPRQSSAVNQSRPRKQSASNQSQSRMPINIHVPTFKDNYYRAIEDVHKVLINSKFIKIFPNIIKTILTPTMQSGGSNYYDDVATLPFASPFPHKLTSSGLNTIKFKQPEKTGEHNVTEHVEGNKYDVVIVGCSPEALYMSILLKLLIPDLKIIVLECGENSRPTKPTVVAAAAAADDPDEVATEEEAGRIKENDRALTNETMMSLKYIWQNVDFPTNLSKLNTMVTKYPSSRGNITTDEIYYHNIGLNYVLNIFPSSFYTEHDIHEYASIFSTNADETAKMQVNILEFFLTRRAIELDVVILHNIAMDEFSNYVGKDTCAIFNATGFFNLLQQKDDPIPDSNKYKCIHGLNDNLKPNPDTSNKSNKLNKYSIIFNTPIENQFRLINKYGHYIALKKSNTASSTLNSFVKNNAEIKNCSNRNKDINKTHYLQWYEENELHLPIISIGKAFRGKIIFEWNYLGFADCFIYGLLFNKIYDATKRSAFTPDVNALSMSPAKVAEGTPVPPDPLTGFPPIPPPVAEQDLEAARQKEVDAARAKLAADEDARAKIAAEEAARAKIAADEAARAKIAAEEAAKAKIAAEEAAKAKLAAEEAAKAKIAAEEAAKAKLAAEEATRAKIAAEEAAKAKLAAEEAAKAKIAAEEAAKAKLAAEEAARQKLAAEEAAKAKQALEEAATAKIAAEEATRAKIAAEEAAKAKLAAEEAARQKLAAEEAAKAKQALEEAATAKQALEDAARDKLAAEEAARAKIAAEEAARAKIAAEEAAKAALLAENAQQKAERARPKTSAKAVFQAKAARAKAAAEEAEKARLAAEEAARAKAAAEEAEKARLAAEQALAEQAKAKIAAEEAARAKAAAEEAEKARLAAEQALAEQAKAKIAAEEAARAKAAAEEAEKARLAAELALAEQAKAKIAADEAERDRLAAAQAADEAARDKAAAEEATRAKAAAAQAAALATQQKIDINPTPLNKLEIVLGTNAPTENGAPLDIIIEDISDAEEKTAEQSSNYLQSVADGASKMMSGINSVVSDAASAALSGSGRGIVAAAKGAADTAANCTSDRAADATRSALEYQVPTKDPAELRKEQDMDAKLDELKHQITDKVADAGELFADNAKKMAKSFANSVTSLNLFNNIASNATKNLLLSQNLNPPVKYLNISINPGIEFNPKMLNKNTSNSEVHFNPLIKYSERIINDVPVGKPNTEIYEKFFNINSFNIMLANTLRGLFGQTPKTIDEATDAGIVDDNIVSTLNTLFATGNVIYINNSPYTIYTYSWNGEWFIDSKIPRNLDYITGTSSSSYIHSYRDQEQMQKYRDRQNAAAQAELTEKGIGSKYRMSSIRRERLIEDAKQREALQKDLDAKTAAKKIEEEEANKKLADKMKIRADRANRPLLELKKKFIQNTSKLIPELNKQGMKDALNAIVSHKQFIRATPEERDIEIDPITISLFFPTIDLLEDMLERTNLTKDYAVITDTYKNLIKIIDEYDAAEMKMYETKTEIDTIFGKFYKLNFTSVEKKEEIIKELLKDKKLPYAIATDKLINPTFAHVGKIFDALTTNNQPVTTETLKTMIDGVDVVLDNEPKQIISKKDTAILIEMVKFLSKQFVTTFYEVIKELLTTVTQFKDMLTKMVEITTNQYSVQKKYYEQYKLFLDKLEQAIGKTTEHVLFLMFIRNDQRTYDKLSQSFTPIKPIVIENIITPTKMDANIYVNKPLIMEIESAHFDRYIAQFLGERYSVSNKLWDISCKSALDARNTINTYINDLKDGYITRLKNEPAIKNYAEYKKHRDVLQNMQTEKITPSELIAQSTEHLFQEDQQEFKRIYDEYDSREGKSKMFKFMFINVAVAEIATLRKITFLTQSINANDIEIYKYTLMNSYLNKYKNPVICKNNPQIMSAFIEINCNEPELDRLLKNNDDAKRAAAQQKQDLTGELTLLSDNQNDMFADLFPIDDNAKLEKMCNQALTRVSTLFEVKTFKTFMSENGWLNSCLMQGLNAPIAKVFKLSMLNEMFTHSSNPISKKVSPSVYKNTNYWDVFCPIRADQSGDFKLLDAVSMLLNAEMHLTSSTIKHEYAHASKFDLKNVGRIIELLNAQQDEDNKLAILYQIFKIKFTIIEITYKQSLHIALSITGCTNKLTAIKKSNDKYDPDYVDPEDIKLQLEREEKLTTFAFIIKCQGNYYIPYNSKIGTLLCSIKHLKSVGLDILLWKNCWTKNSKQMEGAPPSWLKMYQTINQRGGDPNEQEIASITHDNFKELGKPNETTNKSIEERTKENTQINSGSSRKSILKNSVKIADEVSNQDPPAATADTVNYYDKYRVNQTYSRDTKLSYCVAVDLVMVPGTSISLAQKLKLKCQMKSDNIRKSLSDIFGTIYVPTPIFITTSEEYAKSKTDDERNRIIQYQTVSDLVNEKKMNNLKGVEFINAMRETIPRSNRMKNAFTHLRIASGEYNSILKNHDITIEELNSLITDANYQRNFMGGRSKKAARAGSRLRKTRKPSRRF